MQTRAAGLNDEHALLIFLKLSDDDMGAPRERDALFELEVHVESALKRTCAGESDGHEFGKGWGVLYVYGPDARRLSEIVMPLLRLCSPPAGSYVVTRFGAKGAPEERLAI